MKTKKLNLNDLKVESFVTSIEFEKINTLKGGTAAVAVAASVVIATEEVAAAVVTVVAIVAELMTYRESVCASFGPNCYPLYTNMNVNCKWSPNPKK